MRNATQLLPCLSLVWLMLATMSAASGEDSPTAVRRLVTEFCVDCHQADHAEAGINLEAMLASNDFASDFRRWRRFLRPSSSMTANRETSSCAG